ncbi:hypothetical protein MLD38_015129 [Melastoma candidum]|uniref:Uncharacterized protein n=1 Tax=Melastoma candidum TaxID=119954 RepID=A0ACB9REX8_9MYRT|nr:hypothetical protein MLD38_015129 [Melastoma candidum]
MSSCSSSNTHRVVCVRRVKQEAAEDWNESMPLPGDIIEGYAEDDRYEFIPTKCRSDFSMQLGKVGRQVDGLWVKVRRGNNVLKIRVGIVPIKGSLMHRKFTIRAASDDRHVAILDDLDLEQCIELQGKPFFQLLFILTKSTIRRDVPAEMSRKVLNLDTGGYRKKGMKYDWKTKIGTYLPDRKSSVISSILFMPLHGKHIGVEAITARCMVWLSAAISSGSPLVFVNVQTEQIVSSGRSITMGKENSTEMQGQQQQQCQTLQVVQGVRLWFLPGVSEIQFELVPMPHETRFGMDIKLTEEGFICVFSVMRGLAADRAGLGSAHEEASGSGYLLVISRLEGKSLMPSHVCSEGLIHCCEQSEIREVLTSAIDRMEAVQVHIMGWPNQMRSGSSPAKGMAALLPPEQTGV